MTVAEAETDQAETDQAETEAEAEAEAIQRKQKNPVLRSVCLLSTCLFDSPFAWANGNRCIVDR